jgi:hypothetical protein
MNVFSSPLSSGSTQLNSRITTYNDMAARIKRQLGEPLVNVEISNEQIHDNIDLAVEYFTKYAGYTEEYLLFDSRKYVSGVGIRIDTMVNMTETLYATNSQGLSGGYDYDLDTYRKVLDCFSFDYGENTGINTLFTLETAMANQIYSSYMVGNFGFDLVTWEALKGFIDTRKKVLAQTPHFRFDNRTQTLRIIPEPIEQHSYLGVVGCYIERPIKDLVKERWIQRYVLALSKITVANVRGKYPSTNLFGGGTVNYQDFQSQGIAERDALEAELKQGYEDANIPCFFVGALVSMLVPAFLCFQNSLMNILA